MCNRWRRVVTVLTVTIATAPLAFRVVEGQGRNTAPAAAAATGWTAPRTAWGDPDLQGVWRNETAIPFERPAQYAGRATLTPEEIAARQKAEQEELKARQAGADFTAIGRPELKDSPIAGNEYNRFWTETGRPRRIFNQTSMIVDPPDGKMPQLNPELGKRQRHHAAMVSSNPPPDVTNESYVERDTGERCLTDGIPASVYQGTGPNQILQGPGYVIIMGEQFRDRRVIPLDGRPLSPIRQWVGQSRGRWEGNTLVVETTNFADKMHYVWQTYWRGPSDGMQLIERFTRVAPDIIEYQMTVNDPTKFDRPFTARVPITKLDQAFLEYACHEGNYGMLHLLSQARNLEKAAAPSR